MSSLFKTVQQHALLRGIVYILLGVFIFLKPNDAFNVIVYLISAYNAIIGIVKLVNAIKYKENSTMAIAIFYLVFALIILLFAKPLASILPVFLGLIIIFGGVVRVSQSMTLKKYVDVSYLPMMFYGIILILAGVLLLFKPFASLIMLFQFLGALMVFSGISEIINAIRYRNIKDVDIF